MQLSFFVLIGLACSAIAVPIQNEPTEADVPTPTEADLEPTPTVIKFNTPSARPLDPMYIYHPNGARAFAYPPGFVQPWTGPLHDRSRDRVEAEAQADASPIPHIPGSDCDRLLKPGYRPRTDTDYLKRTGCRLRLKFYEDRLRREAEAAAKEAAEAAEKGENVETEEMAEGEEVEEVAEDAGVAEVAEVAEEVTEAAEAAEEVAEVAEVAETMPEVAEIAEAAEAAKEVPEAVEVEAEADSDSSKRALHSADPIATAVVDPQSTPIPSVPSGKSTNASPIPAPGQYVPHPKAHRVYPGMSTNASPIPAPGQYVPHPMAHRVYPFEHKPPPVPSKFGNLAQDVDADAVAGFVAALQASRAKSGREGEPLTVPEVVEAAEAAEAAGAVAQAAQAAQAAVVAEKMPEAAKVEAEAEAGQQQPAVEAVQHATALAGPAPKSGLSRTFELIDSIPDTYVPRSREQVDALMAALKEQYAPDVVPVELSPEEIAEGEAAHAAGLAYGLEHMDEETQAAEAAFAAEEAGEGEVIV